MRRLRSKAQARAHVELASRHRGERREIIEALISGELVVPSQNHGTKRAYRQHLERGEEPCSACAKNHARRTSSADPISYESQLRSWEIYGAARMEMKRRHSREYRELYLKHLFVLQSEND